MNLVQFWKFVVTWGVTLLRTCSTDDASQFFDYDQPEQLQNFLENITHVHSTSSSLLKLSETSEGQPIFCVKIGKGNNANPVIIVEFGAHAREWVSHTSATHVIYELLNNPKYDGLIKKLTWYIVPLLNPDGFRFSKSNEINRFWRKNRRRVSDGCVGVDVNRNFPVKWCQNPECGDEHGGPYEASEQETRAIMQVFNLVLKGTVAAYISVHSDAQSILIPLGYTYDRPKNWKRLHEVAWKMKYAMEWPGSPIYDVYKASDPMLTNGTSADWAYSKGVPLAFTLELPYRKGKDHHLQPFTASPEEKMIIARQCVAALEACAHEILNGGTNSPSMSISVASTWVRFLNAIPGLEIWAGYRVHRTVRQLLSELSPCDDSVRDFLVYRMASGSAAPTSLNPEPSVATAAVTPPPAMDVAPPQPSTPQPMEVEDNVVVAEQLAEELPDVILDVHPDWVPIITRDRERQRRQAAQGPLSDAYLSGMPSKRRKIVSSAKPQGSLARVISESMSSAITAASVPVVENVVESVAADTSVRSAYKEQLRSTLGATVKSHPDFTADKYPNSAKVFSSK